MKLPKHVHRYTSGRHVYYTFQKYRNTSKAGPRITIPYAPADDRFWSYCERLAQADGIEPGTVNELIKRYRKSTKFDGLKEATKRDYDIYLCLMESRLGAYSVTEITPVVLQEMHDSLADRPTTARHFVSVMKSLFKWGIPRGLVNDNPAAHVDLARAKAEGAEPWPAWAFEIIADHARWEVQTFVALGRFTGQRTKDILEMRLSDIDDDTIAVVQSKTDKPLMIPIHRDLWPTIDAARSRGYLWFVPRPDGRPMDTNQFRAMWGRELRKPLLDKIRLCDRPKIKPHGLRKSAVVSLKEAGCRIEEIQAITGQSRQMVEYYGRGYDQEAMARGAVRKWELKE